MKQPLMVVWGLAKVTTVWICIGWCTLQIRKLDSYSPFAVPARTRVPGLILVVLGSILVLTCGGILSTRWDAEPLPIRGRFFPREFVAFGPFRYVRNPMSLGAVMLMLGFGLYERSISVILAGLLLFGFLHLIVVCVEEPGLEKRFGASYQRYKQSVNRWLPRIR